MEAYRRSLQEFIVTRRMLSPSTNLNQFGFKHDSACFCLCLSLSRIHLFCAQVAEVAQILDFLSTQTSLPIVGISGGSAVVIPYKVVPSSPLHIVDPSSLWCSVWTRRGCCLAALSHRRHKILI